MTRPEPGPQPPGDIADRMAEAWQMLLGIGQASALTAEAPSAPALSVSFTLVTGFLGAGKTTLVNKILSEPHGMRIAVIVNDFGSVNIDAALIRRSSVDSIDLANGCVCCTLANGLVRALAALTTRGEPCEHIVLEASGIAEPHGVIQIALCNRALRLNGIVCLIDAETVVENLDNAILAPLIRRQASAADLAVINKVDLAGSEKVLAVHRWLREEAANARRIEALFSDIPASVVLGFPRRRSALAEAASDAHSGAFETFTFVTKHLLDQKRICALAATLPSGVLRAKGILRLASRPHQAMVLQVTAGRWTLSHDAGLPSGTRSEIVVIGLKGAFDAAALRERLRACAVP